jgi:hypothetical protein
MQAAKQCAAAYHWAVVAMVAMEASKVECFSHMHGPGQVPCSHALGGLVYEVTVVHRGAHQHTMALQHSCNCC